MTLFRPTQNWGGYFSKWIKGCSNFGLSADEFYNENIRALTKNIRFFGVTFSF